MSAIFDKNKITLDHKKKDPEMVEVSAEWFKGLLRYAKMTEEAIDKDNKKELKLYLKFNIPGLLGFIDSAKFIIKEK